MEKGLLGDVVNPGSQVFWLFWASMIVWPIAIPFWFVWGWIAGF